MTLLISAQAISKSYGVDALFSNISLGILANEHVGLIGPNGSGKSTLLKILMGLETADAGKVVPNLNAHRVYLAQEDQFDGRQTIKHVLFNSVTEALDEEVCRHHIRQVAGENLFPNLMQTVDTLSGGWRKRLAIIQALLQQPNLLLMDEPTNHLDLEGILWLENLLKKASFAFVLVSHDRYFLENTVNSIIELNKVYPDGYFKVAGNYSNFLQKREEFVSGQLKKEQSLANVVRREQEWLNRGAQARTTKAQYRIDKAEQLKSDLSKLKISNRQNKTAAIDFTSTDRKTKSLLQTHHVKMLRNGKLLFADLNLKLSPGTCLGLLGQNGSGKSTLINLLNGNLQPDAGSVERADHLRIVTFDQKREQLEQNQTLQQALSPAGDGVFYRGANIHVAAWAKRFLFSSDQLQQPVSHLSGGEQARVLIANLMLQPADILLLDEPTNDLDIPTLEVLEESLSEFSGAIVLITHDRFLLDRLSDQLLYLDGKGKVEFFADYAQWYQSMNVTTTKKVVASTETQAGQKKVKKLSYDEQKELKGIADKIHKAEAAMEVFQEQMQNPTILSDPARLKELCSQIQLAKEKVDQLYQRWEELEERA